MCGFVGIFGSDARKHEYRALKMIDLVQHRGPDSCGFHIFDKAILCHARLKIQDLSNGANQPMKSISGRYWLVFNGEIYNFIELRRELRSFYSFATHSDTEVLLAAWERWGEGCLEYIKGMFSFCVYDTLTEDIILVRDRFGQKPLFYAMHENCLVVASEIKPILAFGVTPSPDIGTWARYLLEAAYDDTRQSFFKSVEQLFPGEIVKFNHSLKQSSRYYYQLDSKRIVPFEGTLRDARTLIRETMVKVCDMHMRSDVNVGVMLSGGLDSSSMLSALNLRGHAGNNLRSFSVDFGGSFTERPWIEEIASEYAVNSHISSFTQAEFLSSIKPMMWHLEGPIGGLMNCALSKVMTDARSCGITVLLDGTGPDEAFGGYRNHHNTFLASLIQSGEIDVDEHLKNYSDVWDTTIEEAREAALKELSLAHFNTAIDGTVPVQRDCLKFEFTEYVTPELVSSCRTGDAVKDSLVSYLSGSKILRNNRFLDRISMAYSIELRLPFLEDEFVELGINMPNSWYFLDGYTKGVIRSAFDGFMPDSVRMAKKRSIQAPQGLWLQSKLMQEYVWDMLHTTEFATRGFFDPGRCQTKYRQFLDGKYDNSFFVWQWINVEEWHQVFVDNNSAKTRYAFLS